MNQPPNNIEVKLDISNYINEQYDDYCDSVKGIALSKPGAYFNHRQQVSKNLKTDAIEKLYETIWQALRKGKRVDGRRSLSTVPEFENLVPALSDNNINEISIALCKTLKDELNKVVDKICPVTANDAGENRLKAIGNLGGVIGVP